MSFPQNDIKPVLISTTKETVRHRREEKQLCEELGRKARSNHSDTRIARWSTAKPREMNDDLRQRTRRYRPIIEVEDWTYVNLVFVERA